jgi:hypothetical protein
MRRVLLHHVALLTHFAVAGILALALVLNLSNLGFPLAFHADEPTKIEFIEGGTQDFHHPLLMLQLVRAARWVQQPVTDEELVVVGRGLMGVVGAISVLLMFVLARQRLSRPWALGAAGAVAVSPTLVVHAHYLDERTLLTASVLAAAVAFFRFVRVRTPAASLWLGLATGLAWSSHFLAILLLPLFALAPLMGAPQPARDFFAGLFRAVLAAGAVFLMVNWPLLRDVGMFVEGLQTGAQHAASGHDVVIHGHHYWFAFHLVNSLAAGMTWPTLLVAIGGLVATAWGWKRADFQDRWIVAAAVLFYLAVEIAPLKPWPDYSGYAIPVVPFLLYIAARGGARLVARAPLPAVRASVAATLVSALIVYPMYDSTRLVNGLAHDTRTRAAAWLEVNPGRVLIEKYASVSEDVRSVAELDTAFNQLGVDYILASSFMYERFRVGSQLPGQDPAVYRAQARYDALFAHPFIEITPAYRSLAFSNPTIRIVDLRPSSVRVAHPIPLLRPLRHP